MHTLQAFVLKNVVPAAEAVSDPHTGATLPDKRAAYARMFESFLWLHLGQELGNFPLEPARSVFSSFYDPFFGSLVASTDRTLEEQRHLFRAQLYVVDTQESRELKATFPDFTILIGNAMRGEDVFKSQLNNFGDHSVLKPVFRNFLRLGSLMESDRLLHDFTVMSQFSDGKSWAAQWQPGRCTPEEVAEAGNGRSSNVSSTAAIFCGFIRLWSYSHQLREMSTIYEVEQLRSDDRFKMIDRIKGILRWRVNLRSAETAARFDSVKSALRSRLDEQAKGSVELQKAVDEIKNSFDAAFEFWSSFATVGA